MAKQRRCVQRKKGLFLPYKKARHPFTGPLFLISAAFPQCTRTREAECRKARLAEQPVHAFRLRAFRWAFCISRIPFCSGGRWALLHWYGNREDGGKKGRRVAGLCADGFPFMQRRRFGGGRCPPHVQSLTPSVYGWEMCREIDERCSLAGVRIGLPDQQSREGTTLSLCRVFR